MKIKNRFRYVLSAGIAALCISTAVIYSGCSKSEDKESCSDGIQNQGETGVDCGGPCTSCALSVCTGTNKTSYWPLAMQNYWAIHQSWGFPDYSDTIIGTATYLGKTWFDFVHEYSLGGGQHTYFRTDSATGDVYQYDAGSEYKEVPGTPVVNQQWTDIDGYTRKVTSLNGSVTTSECTYTSGLLVIEVYNGSSLFATMYFKKGLGMVYKGYTGLGGGSLTLFAADIN